MSEKFEKSDAEWRQQLSDEQYYVTRQRGTERPFTGVYWNEKRDGVYACICCGEELFLSDHKYDSGTGWPSFWQPIDESKVREEHDHSLGMHRVEALCGKCDAHLGHIFPDGPRPSGSRYCLNSASLNLKAKPDDNA